MIVQQTSNLNKSYVKIKKKYLIIMAIFSSLVSCDNDKDNNAQIKTQQKPKTATYYYNLASDYYFGEGVKQDYKKAEEYYIKEA